MGDKDIEFSIGSVEVVIGSYTCEAKRGNVVLISMSTDDLIDNYYESNWKDFHGFARDYMIRKIQIIQ